MLLESPSPKFQSQVVGEPVDVSLNFTVRGAVPEVGDAVNKATSGVAVVVGIVVAVVVGATVVVVVVGIVVAVVVVLLSAVTGIAIHPKKHSSINPIRATRMNFTELASCSYILLTAP